MADTIKFKRGAKAKLPSLNYGEPAFVSDEKELYIGTKTGNVKLTSKSEIEELKQKNTELSSQLEQKIDKNGHYDNTESEPFLEASTLGSGSVLHLLAGEGSTAPYVVGIGVDHGTITGVHASVKDSGIGYGLALETTSTDTARGFLGQVLGSGKLIDLVQGTGTGFPMVNIRNPWGGQRDLINLSTHDWEYRVSPTGVLEYWKGGTDEHPQCFIAEKISGSTYEKFILCSANTTQYFATRISASSNYFTIQQCVGTGLGYSNFNWNTILKIRDGNAIGFYGVEPVTRKQITEVTIENIFSALKNLGLVAQ